MDGSMTLQNENNNENDVESVPLPAVPSPPMHPVSGNNDDALCCICSDEITSDLPTDESVVFRGSATPFRTPRDVVAVRFEIVSGEWGCQHVNHFHYQCSKQWFESQASRGANPSCPLCMVRIGEIVPVNPPARDDAAETTVVVHPRNARLHPLLGDGTHCIFLACIILCASSLLIATLYIILN